MCDYSSTGALFANACQTKLLRHILHLFLRFRCLSDSNSIKKPRLKKSISQGLLGFLLPKFCDTKKFYIYAALGASFYLLGLYTMQSEQYRADEPQYQLTTQEKNKWLYLQSSLFPLLHMRSAMFKPLGWFYKEYEVLSGFVLTKSIETKRAAA